MSKLIHLFLFDIKLLRYLYSLPFVVHILCMILIINFGSSSDSPFTSYTIVQGIAVPIAGWHLVFLYASLYDNGAKEALINYYRKVIIIDIVRYMLLHAIFILLLIFLTIKINGVEFFNSVLSIHLLILFVFYQIVGIAILSATRSLEISLGIIATYTFMEVVTQGTFMPWPHLFIFEEPVINIWLILTFISLGVGILVSIYQIWREFK
ncbi:hypothetical protein SAMN05216389_10674 [Oceanobacillus limi]|uniref:ABC-2 type transport system permease protein n=1 Tax=Oceanobacillus limi TaxID=930131 RepID=A0A1I0C860_9BACI|nr:hypothetical protein [Oceanobacillus limi]SET15407.1 hypothetical protein SAMN05216389_10674 [Oceanobacillus limi]